MEYLAGFRGLPAECVCTLSHAKPGDRYMAHKYPSNAWFLAHPLQDYRRKRDVRTKVDIRNKKINSGMTLLKLNFKLPFICSWVGVI